MKLSVIIPAYNEATYIDRLLEALSNQNYKQFEVIVSDAQSHDGTREVVETFKDKLNVHFIEAPPKGPGFGRNQGAKVAHGEWLLFLDADGDFDDPNFLGTLLSETEAKGWGTSSAKMTINNFLHFRLGVWLFYRYQKRLAKSDHPVAQGYCILTKRKIFEENHGFNEKILLGEDNDYVSRVGPKYGFGFVNDTYYYVDMRRTRTDGWLSYSYKAIANEFYRQRHPDRLDTNKFAYKFGRHPLRKK